MKDKKNNGLKNILVSFLVLLLVTGIPVNTYAADPITEEPVIEDPIPEPIITPPAIKKVSVPSRVKAAIAIDPATGEIYASKNANTALPVASVSKLMTVWLAFEKINKGASIKQKVRIKSRKIEKMSRSGLYGGSVLHYGKTYTVEDLIKLTVIESSNAASIQLGIWVAGSNKAFINKMNKEAKKLGLKKSSFTSACGLNNFDMKKYGLVVRGGKDGTNKMSAKDIAILAGMLMDKYPKVLKYSSSTKAKVKGKKLKNTNQIITNGKIKKKARALKVDGLKTGTTRRAGPCFASTCKPKGKKRIVTVILNDSYRFTDTVDLMNKIYAKNSKRLSENN